jgi:hypothetical protein
MNDLVSSVTLAGALGATSMGMVETLKKSSPWIASIGRTRLMEVLGREALLPLAAAYGAKGLDPLLDAAFRQSDEELARTLRTGIKIGFVQLAPDKRKGVAGAFGQEEEALVEALSQAPEASENVSDEALTRQRHALAQFELAVDTRVAAAVASSTAKYTGSMQLLAGGFALTLALIGAVATLPGSTDTVAHFGLAFVVGVAAVPIAPLAKDLTSALHSVTSAFAVRR